MNKITTIAKTTLLCAFIVLFVQCQRTRPTEKIPLCDELLFAAVDDINNFCFQEDSIYLNLALMTLNKAALFCPESKFAIFYNKAYVYYYKKDYANAIRMLDQVRDSDFDFPERKVLFQEKLRAKSAGEQGDSITQKRHYRNIIATLDNFLEAYSLVIDSIMHLPDEEKIKSTLCSMNLTERYYYREKLVGKQKTLTELDSLQKATGYNQDYINWVKDVVSGDKGQSIQILFE